MVPHTRTAAVRLIASTRPSAHLLSVARTPIMRLSAARSIAHTTPTNANTTPTTPIENTNDEATSAASEATTVAATNAAAADSTPASDSTGDQKSHRAPTDDELLTVGQRRFFHITDWLLGGFLGLMVGKLLQHLLDWPDVLDECVAAASEDELIQSKVGTPVKASFRWSGSVNEHNASLVIPISGPNGTATLHARAFYDTHFKAWKLMLFQVSFDDTEGAQKHSLIIPERFIVRPRYVSPEEALRIRQKHDDMIAKLAESHAKKAAAQQQETTTQTQP